LLLFGSFGLTCTKSESHQSSDRLSSTEEEVVEVEVDVDVEVEVVVGERNWRCVTVEGEVGVRGGEV
jgi:hypothetical protein